MKTLFTTFIAFFLKVSYGASLQNEGTRFYATNEPPEAKVTQGDQPATDLDGVHKTIREGKTNYRRIASEAWTDLATRATGDDGGPKNSIVVDVLSGILDAVKSGKIDLNGPLKNAAQSLRNISAPVDFNKFVTQGFDNAIDRNQQISMLPFGTTIATVAKKLVGWFDFNTLIKQDGINFIDGAVRTVDANAVVQRGLEVLIQNTGSGALGGGNGSSGAGSGKEPSQVSQEDSGGNSAASTPSADTTSGGKASATKGDAGGREAGSISGSTANENRNRAPTSGSVAAAPKFFSALLAAETLII